MLRNVYCELACDTLSCHCDDSFVCFQQQQKKMGRHNICTCKTMIYMSNVQYYTIIEEHHQCNWSFRHQSQQSPTCP